jgi:hypothetical protein
VFQIVDFSSVNDLKFTYVHLQFQKFSRGLYPRAPMHDEGEGRERRGGQGKGGKEGTEREGRGAREGRDGMG